MNSLYKMSRKRILALFASSILIIVVIANFSTSLVNNYYSDQLILNENQKFVNFFIHSVEFDSEVDAIKYISHYSHVNNVGIILTYNDEVLYKTEQIPLKASIYEFEVNQRQYKIFIDNSKNSIVVINDRESYFINLIVIISMSFLLLYVVVSRRTKNRKVIHDISKIEQLMKDKHELVGNLNYIELQEIFNGFHSKIRTIDLLEEKRKDNLNGLVHDLKTPITILLNHLDETNTLEDLINNKDVIKVSLEDLSSTASDLISENFMGVRRRFNLSVQLEKELQNYISTFSSKNILLKYSILNDVIIEWNKRDFGRVLRNLLTNAFYYSDNYTKVYVHLLNGRSNYELKVINTGKLIKQEDLIKIFSKDIRDSNDDNIQGNGFGLYITKLLVEEIGASIFAESNEKENKNVFTIQFKKDQIN